MYSGLGEISMEIKINVVNRWLRLDLLRTDMNSKFILKKIVSLKNGSIYFSFRNKTLLQLNCVPELWPEIL
jgi:hypothetical protein